ncbi:MAG: glycosyltransferase, partial [Thermoplasmata archaeon]
MDGRYEEGISIVIPAYNEENRIKSTLDDIINYIHTHNMNNIEVIVVVDTHNDDTKKDKTSKIVTEYGQAYPSIVKPYVRKDRNGKGGAIKRGIKLAKYSIVAYADADKSSSFEEVMKLVNAIDGVDCSIGVRKSRNYSFIRRFASKGYLYIAKFLFNLPYDDLQCGYKAFKHIALDEV